MIITIDIQPNLYDEFIETIKKFKNGIKVLQNKNSFMKGIEESKKDIENNRLIEINDIDNYIKELENEIRKN